MAWPELGEPGGTLLFPLGATEQHGHHLPLDTDTRIAAAWCGAVAETRSDVWVAPAMPYGSSGEHADFPGTISIGTTVLTTVLVEMARSTLPPFDRLVFVNGHGGNHDAVTAAVEQCRDEGRNVDAVWPRLPNADAHAGRTETSLMLAIAPDTVSQERAAPGNTEPIPVLMSRLRSDGLRAHSETGVLGDPTGATAQEGHRLLELLVAQLISRLG